MGIVSYLVPYVNPGLANLLTKSGVSLFAITVIAFVLAIFGAISSGIFYIYKRSSFSNSNRTTIKGNNNSQKIQIQQGGSNNTQKMD